MATLTIRNLTDQVVERLKQRARDNERSLEQKSGRCSLRRPPGSLNRREGRHPAGSMNPGIGAGGVAASSSVSRSRAPTGQAATQAGERSLSIRSRQKSHFIMIPDRSS